MTNNIVDSSLQCRALIQYSYYSLLHLLIHSSRYGTPFIRRTINNSNINIAGIVVGAIVRLHLQCLQNE